VRTIANFSSSMIFSQQQSPVTPIGFCVTRWAQHQHADRARAAPLRPCVILHG
jgi:hypothetical protein